MITATVPKTGKHKMSVRKAELIKRFKHEARHQVRNAELIQQANLKERADILNDTATGTILSNLEERFIAGDYAKCDGIEYILWVHPELDLVGIYNSNTDKLTLMGEYKLIRPYWVPLVQSDT